jgi:hypothetical protein
MLASGLGPGVGNKERKKEMTPYFTQSIFVNLFDVLMGVFIMHKIHPEDGNCNVCQNVGRTSTNDTAEIQEPILYITHQLLKFKDKKHFSIIYTTNSNIQ